MSDQAKTNNEHKEKHVGYFCHLKVDEKHMGGILITNQLGIPLEFKYTEPVVATRLHKILYGSVLEKYLHETVIRDRLVAELRTHPEYFIVPYDEKEFLGSVEGREMVAVQKYNMPAGELSGPFNRVREREAVMELEEDSILLRLAFSTSDEVIQHNIAAWLQEIALTMNLLEPMDRITSALKSICGEEKSG